MKIRTLTTIGADGGRPCRLRGSALADAAAGKATFDEDCAECHEAADTKGEDVKELTATIEKISAGQMKHKKAFKLTPSRPPTWPPTWRAAADLRPAATLAGRLPGSSLPRPKRARPSR